MKSEPGGTGARFRPSLPRLFCSFSPSESLGQANIVRTPGLLFDLPQNAPVVVRVVLGSVLRRRVHQQLQRDRNAVLLQPLHHVVLHLYPLGDVFADDRHPFPVVMVEQGQDAWCKRRINGERSGKRRVERLVRYVRIAAHLKRTQQTLTQATGLEIKEEVHSLLATKNKKLSRQFTSFSRNLIRPSSLTTSFILN